MRTRALAALAEMYARAGRHADAAAVGVFAVGHGITSVKNKMDLFVRKWDM